MVLKVARLSESDQPVVVLEKLDGKRRRAGQNGRVSNGVKTTDASKQRQQQQQLQLLAERESLVLWRHPVRTTSYFVLELGILCSQLFQRYICRVVGILSIGITISKWALNRIE